MMKTRTVNTAFSLAIVLSVLTFNSATFAADAITIEDITGVSARTLGTTPFIYGGTAGVCPAFGDATCNSCLTTLTACNEVRIQNDLTVVFSIKTTGTGPVKVIETDSETSVGTNPGTSSTQATVTWDELCAFAGIVGDCNTPNAGGETAEKTVNVRVWQDFDPFNGTVDAGEAVTVKVHIIPAGTDSTGITTDCSGDGVCPFRTFPGDEKISLDDMVAPSPLSNGEKIAFVRVYISDVNFDQANPVDYYAIQDLAVDTDGNMKVPIVEGLSNGVVYHFRLAVVDKAMNAFEFTDNAYISATDTGGDATCNTAGGAPASPIATCDHAGMPDQVLGLLNKDLNCFIATAAYDSGLEPKLNVFRQFRHSILLRSELGKSFVRWYYKEGPKGALLMHERPWLKKIVRVFLWPAYGFATLSLRWGFALATTLFVFLPLILITAFFTIRQRSGRGKT